MLLLAWPMEVLVIWTMENIQAWKCIHGSRSCVKHGELQGYDSLELDTTSHGIRYNFLWNWICFLWNHITCFRNQILGCIFFFKLFHAMDEHNVATFFLFFKSYETLVCKLHNTTKINHNGSHNHLKRAWKKFPCPSIAEHSLAINTLHNLEPASMSLHQN